ncbi:hypothetical protein Tco_1563362 [Tanacetum coccineum]
MGVETTSHLFFTCDMAQQVSRLIIRWWDVPDLEMDSYGSWKIWMVNLRMPSKNKNMLAGLGVVNDDPTAWDSRADCSGIGMANSSTFVSRTID